MRTACGGGAVCAFVISALLEIVLAALVNVSIDDTYGDPRTGTQFVYLPDGAWNDATDCNGCTAHPDPSQTYQGTWHDGTFNPLPGSNMFPNQTLSASVQFSGTALYVFCIVAHTSTSPDGNSDMQFFIDNQYMGKYTLLPSNSTTYSYNVSVFSTDQLIPGNHTFTLQDGRIGGQKALTLLDYITYTYDDELESSNTTSPKSSTRASSSNHSESKMGTIVGAIVGSVGGLSLVAFGLACYLRYQRKRECVRNLADDSFVRPPPRMPGIDPADGSSDTNDNWVDGPGLAAGAIAVSAFPTSSSRHMAPPPSVPSTYRPVSSNWAPSTSPTTVSGSDRLVLTSFLSMSGARPVTDGKPDEDDGKSSDPLSPGSIVPSKPSAVSRRIDPIEGVMRQEPGSRAYDAGLQAFQRVFNPLRRGPPPGVRVEIPQAPYYDADGAAN